MLILYGLVSTDIGQAIDLFLDREAAEETLAKCLSVERIELDAGSSLN